MARGRVVRTALGLGAALAVASALLVLVTPAGLPMQPAALAGYLAARQPADAVAAVLALAGWVVLGWLIVGSLAAAGSVLPGLAGAACSSIAGRITPVALRRTVEVLVGVGVATAGTAGQLAAAATPGPAHPPAKVAVPPARADAFGYRSGPCLDRPATRPLVARPPVATPGAAPAIGSRRPTGPGSLDRPGARAISSRPAGRVPSGRDTTVVVVRPGDSLWAIAARHLGPDPPDAAVAASWPRWYQRNRAVVGPDPDLLRPGQRLVAPTDPPFASEEHP
jgi:resuscitation-promoting factor RpfA